MVIQGLSALNFAKIPSLVNVEEHVFFDKQVGCGPRQLADHWFGQWVRSIPK